MGLLEAFRAHASLGILIILCLLIILGVVLKKMGEDLYIIAKKTLGRFFHSAKLKLSGNSNQQLVTQSPTPALSVESISTVDEIVSPQDFLKRLDVSKNLQAIIARTAEEFEIHGDWATLAILRHDAVERDAVDEVDEVFKMPSVLGGVQNDEKVELTGLGLMLAGTAPNTSKTMARLAEICAQRKFSHQNEARIGTEILTTEYGFSEDEARRAHGVMRKIPGMVGNSSVSENHWDADIHHGALSYLKVQDAHGLLNMFARKVGGLIPPS